LIDLRAKIAGLDSYIQKGEDIIGQDSQLRVLEYKEEELEKLLGDDKWKYEQDRVENHATPNHSVTPITTKK
jgi:hypothetical protein